jgi:hypothetical protein
MAMTRREWMASAIAAGALPASGALAATGGLRAAARDAWIYTLPLIEMAATRAGTLQPPGRPPLATNSFRHARGLSTPEDRLVTSPNNDTLFSNAWIDLTAGPVTLTIPPSGSRYISVAVMNMYTDNDAVLGTRTVGNGGGRFTLVGPQETGSGPGVVRVATPHAWILVRTLVDGEQDLAAAHAVQDGLLLEGAATPLPPAYATRHASWSDYFTSAQQLLVADPPPATDRRILNQIAPLGLDARGGFDPSRFSPAEVADIAAGVEDARSGLIQGGGGAPAVIQGWTYPRSDVGIFGQDYAFRANVALVGLAALPNVEAMYMRPVTDEGRGGIITGDAAYRLSFEKGKFPPVDAFWSLTMYEVTDEKQAFLTRNPINRYSIGDRTPGLKFNDDGSLDIWISRADPGGARSANWLPAPAEGPYRMTFRTYLPRADIVNGSWRIPALQKL